MKIIYLIILALSLLAACSDNTNELALDGDENKTEYPNILLIIADDMGLDATPGYSEGSQKPAMPNLDRLAKSGITFDNAWSYPLCSPTRASILTGKHGFRTEVLTVENAYISTSETSLYQFLDSNSDGNYAHAQIGKWHLSKFNQLTVPNDMGVDYFAGQMQGGLQDYNSWTLNINGTSEPCDEYHTSKLTNLCIDWINEQTKPWFCWLAYSAPHTPFHYPPAEMHQQDESDGSELSMYLAMIESMDYQMGRLFNSMDENTLANTIVIFVGDNGTDKNVLQLPYRGRKAKGSLYQGGINVPLIVAGKGVSRQNVRDNNQISTTDLFATIGDIAGRNTANYMDSYSFKALLNQETRGLRQYNFSEVDHGDDYRYAITDGIYKLITNNDKNDELYNLSDDPYETTNLFL